MTDTIEWGKPLTGPEIKALGLPDDTPVRIIGADKQVSEYAHLSFYDVLIYRLPADHHAYIIHHYNKDHGTNFVYWAGGKSAPDDWDGGPQISRSGEVDEFVIWSRPWSKDFDPEGNWDIIGYTKKPQLVTEEASEPLQSAASGTAPASHGPAADDKGEAGDFIPCERTVRMCIEAVPFPADGMGLDTLDYGGMVIDALEALLPKPDRAEELVKKYQQECPAVSVWGFSDVKNSPFELNFAKWLIERGEIKG